SDIQALLKGIGCTICLQSPHLHLSETLSAELGFTTQRLLSYQRVWTCRTCVDLIIYQMMEFQVMHVSDGYRAVEVFSCTSVSQSYLSISGNRNSLPQFSVSLVLIQELHNFRAKGILIFFTEFFKIFCIYIVISQFQSILDIHLVGAVKYRSSDIESQSLCCKTQVDLQLLSDIHTGRHAQRIQHNVQRTAVRQIGRAHV